MAVRKNASRNQFSTTSTNLWCTGVELGSLIKKTIQIRNAVRSCFRLDIWLVFVAVFSFVVVGCFLFILVVFIAVFLGWIFGSLGVVVGLFGGVVSCFLFVSNPFFLNENHGNSLAIHSKKII